MQLPDFIKRALAFFDTAEKQLKASGDASAGVAELEKANKTLEGTVAERDTSIKDLQGKMTAAEGTIKTLQGDLAKEKARANTVIAGQGLPADQTPAAETTNGAAVATQENAWNKYQRLLSENPREAGQFWATNADDIMKARNEKK